MRTTGSAQSDPAPGVTNVTTWHATSVRALENFRLEVKFADGTHGVVDMSRLLARECGVFKPLREVSLFNLVRVDQGAVTWPGELDLAPDTMHGELRNANIYVMK